jgi:hypothetical protein
MASAKQKAAARKNIKKAQAARRKKKGGKRRKATRKGTTRRRARKAVKRAAKRATARPFTTIDNILATLNFLGPVFEAWRFGRDNPGMGGQHLVSSYTGLLFDQGWGYRDFDAKRLARGYGPLGSSILYKKQMSLLNKMAPVKGVVPRSIGDVRNIATNVIGRIGAFSAAKHALEAGSGRKMNDFTRQFTQNFTGIDLDDNLNYFGWDAFRLYRGQAPFAASIIFHKGTGLLTRQQIRY